jgi:hypothetical protein
MKKTEIAFAVLGIATAITVFLAQGPYQHLWQYALALSPLVFAAVIIAARRGWARARHFVNALLHAKEAYDLVTATDMRSTFTVRVLNSDGDLLYERYYHIVLIKDGVSIRKTRQDLVGAEIPIDRFPPKAVVKLSKPKNMQLTPTDVTYSRRRRGDREHYDYRWCYEIVPPLRNKGDYVDYSYSAEIPRCEATAFTDRGSLFFFHHEAIPLDIHYSLIAPPNYRIEIDKTWVEDLDGARSEVPTPDQPHLDDSNQVLQWKPTYRRRSCFVCKYRFVRA